MSLWTQEEEEAQEGEPRWCSFWGGRIHEEKLSLLSRELMALWSSLH